MIKRYRLHHLTVRDYVGVIAFLMLAFLMVFVALDVDSKSTEATGTVEALGMNTATRYSLSVPLIQVRLVSGRVVSVEVPRHMNFAHGDNVVLAESSGLLTSGKRFRFLRKQRIREGIGGE